MALTDNKFYKTYRKHEGFFMAVEGLMIIGLLIVLWFMYFHDLQLKEEISLQCGWGEDDYYCYCEKSEAMKIKNLVENSDDDLNFTEIYDDPLDA